MMIIRWKGWDEKEKKRIKRVWNDEAEEDDVGCAGVMIIITIMAKMGRREKGERKHTRDQLNTKITIQFHQTWEEERKEILAEVPHVLPRYSWSSSWWSLAKRKDGTQRSWWEYFPLLLGQQILTHNPYSSRADESRVESPSSGHPFQECMETLDLLDVQHLIREKGWKEGISVRIRREPQERVNLQTPFVYVPLHPFL